MRILVWGLIGPYFFENENGIAITVNGIRYREMITNFLWHEIDDMDVEDIWFQQDGATCHTANETMQLLQTKFNGRVISQRGDVNWPPRSCDLTPLDFFLWGYLKDKVYINKPQTIEDLKEEIRHNIAEICPQLCNMSWKISLKELICAATAKAVICQMFCSTHNLNVSTFK